MDARAVGHPALEDCFSADYPTARMRFREAARSAGARLHELPLRATGPHGEALGIDIAWLGPPAPQRVLVHTSGIHGVEAYAGSAVQLALLAELPRTAPGTALALVHVLNPYGMAWLRRANENNVDLNRNFLPDGAPRSGAAPLYRTLDRLLNPPTPPRRDAFVLRAVLQVLRHGYAEVQQAVAQGQYDFPQGLFYGGARLEEGPRLYLEWLRANLSATAIVLAIDVHTGLGPWGVDTLLVEPGYRPPSTLASALSRPLRAPVTGGASAYAVRGGLAAGMRSALPAAQLHGFVQELGTYSALHVISALREENRWHFHGAGTLGHPVKARLKRALCPPDSAWRREAVVRGTRIAHEAMAWLAREIET